MPKRVLEGIVVSDKCHKTVSVLVSMTTTHPKYKKIITKTKKHTAHDEENEYKTGDVVRIIESIPISKKKRWKVIKKVK